MIHIEWGAAIRPKAGQTVSGDAYAMHHHESRIVASVIDGLGGGVEAARAAGAAVQSLEKNVGWSPRAQMEAMHSALHGTRGAVIAIMQIDLERPAIQFVGVGNIGVHVYTRQAIKPISRNGIVGFRMPSLLELSYVYEPGDVIVMYSDGVSSRFWQDARLDLRQPARLLADQLLATYGKTTDDATVLVIKTAPDSSTRH